MLRDDRQSRQRLRLPDDVRHRRHGDHPAGALDGPAGRPIAEVLADPLTLSTDEVVRRTEYVLAGRFATIATTRELLDAGLARAS